MWIFIWILLSGFILGVFAWSMSILYHQKKAWRDLAKTAGLDYQSGGLTGAPSVNGRIKDYIVSFHTEAQPTEDARAQRYVTVLEFDLGEGMPTGAAFATKEYKAFLEGLDMKQTFRIDHDDWQKDYIVLTRDVSLAQSYLTDKRKETLVSIFGMKNSSTLFFFDELDAVLRIETSDPLKRAGHLKKIVKRLIAALDILSPTEEEKSLNKDRREIAEEKERQRREEIEQQARKRAKERKKQEVAGDSEPVLTPVEDIPESDKSQKPGK